MMLHIISNEVKAKEPTSWILRQGQKTVGQIWLVSDNYDAYLWVPWPEAGIDATQKEFVGRYPELQQSCNAVAEAVVHV